MRIVAIVVGFVSLASLGALVACGSSTTSTPTPAPSDGGTNPEGSVVTGSTFTVLTVTVGAGTPTILKGVPVVFDKPGGERVEKTSGQDGLVTFDGIDWSKGTATVTAIPGTGAALSTFTGLNPQGVAKIEADFQIPIDGSPKRDLSLYCLDNRDPATLGVTLSGDVANKATANSFSASATVHTPVPHQGNGNSYSLRVEPGKPFSLIGLEWTMLSSGANRIIEQPFVRWLKWDQAAITADTTLNLDLNAGQSLTSTKVTGKLTIPGGNTGALGGTSIGYFFVSSKESGLTAFLGAPTKIAPSVDGSTFDYQAEYVQPAGATLYTFYRIVKQDQAFSIVAKSGAPADAQTVDGFVDPPAVSVQSQPLFEPVALEGFPAEARPRLSIADADDNLRWMIQAMPGDKSIKIARPTDAALTKLGAAGQARMLALTAPDSAIGQYTKVGISRPFRVTK